MPTTPSRAKLAAVTDTDTGEARCTARSKSTADRCRNRPIMGAAVCRVHGGAAPQVQRSARQRLAAMVDPALDALDEVVRGTAYGTTAADRRAAAATILDRTGYHARLGIDVDAAADELAAVLAELDAER